MSLLLVDPSPLQHFCLVTFWIFFQVWLQLFHFLSFHLERTSEEFIDDDKSLYIGACISLVNPRQNIWLINQKKTVGYISQRWFCCFFQSSPSFDRGMNVMRYHRARQTKLFHIFLRWFLPLKEVSTQHKKFQARSRSRSRLMPVFFITIAEGW